MGSPEMGLNYQGGLPDLTRLHTTPWVVLEVERLLCARVSHASPLLAQSVLLSRFTLFHMLSDWLVQMETYTIFAMKWVLPCPEWGIVEVSLLAIWSSEVAVWSWKNRLYRCSHWPSVTFDGIKSEFRVISVLRGNILDFLLGFTHLCNWYCRLLCTTNP